MLNFHTSCVFYRVMETMIPSKASSIQHSRLMQAANVSISSPFISTLHHFWISMNWTCRKQGSPAHFIKISSEKISPVEAALMCMKCTALRSLYVRTKYCIDLNWFIPFIWSLLPYLSGQRQLRQRVPCHPSSYRRRASSKGDERRPDHQLLPAQATHGDFYPEESWSPQHYQDPGCLFWQTFRLYRHGPLQRWRTFRTSEL